MNVLNFEPNNCKRVRAHLDSYLNHELPAETTHEVSIHLENCPDCYEALLARQQVKERLQGAVRKDSAPADLQEKIRRSIRQNPSTNRTRWVLVAAAAVALIAVGGGALQLFHSGTPADSAAGNADARLLTIGLDDHVHCAIELGFANRVVTEAEMVERLGADFGGLVATVQENAPENYRLVVGHRCKANGREFVHLILKSPETAISLVITRKNNESFSGETVTAVIGSSGIAVHDALMKDYRVVGFETRGYLAFVVSNLGRTENLQLASTIAPAVRGFLTNHEAKG